METSSQVKTAIETFPLDGIYFGYYAQWTPLLDVLSKAQYEGEQKTLKSVAEVLANSCPKSYTEIYADRTNYPIDGTNQEKVGTLDALANEVQEIKTSGNVDIQRLYKLSDDVCALIGTYNLADIEAYISKLNNPSTGVVLEQIS